MFRPLTCAAAMWLAGCAARPVVSEPLAQAGVVVETIGLSVQGRPIECLSLDHRADADGITVMFIATIHGNEPAGTPLLHRLLRQASLDPSPPWMRDRRLILIPVANPDGCAADHRGNAHGIDLNRNFPAASFASRRRHGSQPLSEPESRALHEAIVHHKPDRIVSIHQPIACIDYDGPAGTLAQVMADALPDDHRLPVRKLGAYPGSLGSFAGEDLGIPIITVELPAGVQQLGHERLWSRYGPMLVAAVESP